MKNKSSSKIISANKKTTSTNKTTIADKITILRICLLPALMYCIAASKNTIALIILGAIIATDILDGYIARKTKTETKSGEELDRAADNAIIIGAITMLVLRGSIQREWGIAIGILSLSGFIAEKFIKPEQSIKPIQDGKQTKKQQTKQQILRITSKAFGAINYIILIFAITSTSATAFFLQVFLWLSAGIGAIRLIMILAK